MGPPAGDAWSAAIAKTAQQEKLFETDEERDRRAERLERDSALSGGYARGRIGIRGDTGIWFNEYSSRHVDNEYGDYSSGDGDVEGMLVPGFYLAQPLGDGFELTGLASFALGAGQFLTFGPGLELGARGVIADQVHLGVLLHVAGWMLEHEHLDSSSCSGSVCTFDTKKTEDFGPFFHAGATGGMFLDPGRQLEVGVNFRAGIHTDSEEISIYTTAHVAYLWPLW